MGDDKVLRLIEAADKVLGLVGQLADISHAATRSIEWGQPTLNTDIEALQRDWRIELLMLVDALDGAATRGSDDPASHAVIAWVHGAASLRAASRLAELVGRHDEALAGIIRGYAGRLRGALVELAVAYTAAAPLLG